MKTYKWSIPMLRSEKAINLKNDDRCFCEESRCSFEIFHVNFLYNKYQGSYARSCVLYSKKLIKNKYKIFIKNTKLIQKVFNFVTYLLMRLYSRNRKYNKI